MTSPDINELEQRDAAQGRLAELDPITKLPARNAYRQYLDAMLARAYRREATCALFLINLDRFKGVNDAFGLTFGDHVLKNVAKRLRGLVGSDDMVGRFGNDDFVILQQEINDRTAARIFAARLNKSLYEPFLIRGEELRLTASIGMSMFPRDGCGSDQLLRNAELAKCRAKALGRNTACFSSPQMNMTARRQGLLERELRRAVAAHEFTVYYQPRQAIDNDQIIGMEALLRWQHPRRGVVRPSEFIALAETIGLINPITENVLEQACRHALSWTEKGLPALQLAVNFSPIQFRDEAVVELVKSMITRTGIAPETLEIELTEGVMLENSRVAIDNLNHLNNLGVTFSLDDFGTGYSSLSYIHRLPVQRLKIDQSFVHRLGRDGQNEATIRAIIDLGHDLDLKITAEGVETSEQLEQLKALGCDEVQGDLISPPLPAESFLALLTQQEANSRSMG